MRLFYNGVFAELYGFFDENGVGGVAGNAPPNALPPNLHQSSIKMTYF
jgi:hypothetical protein